MADELARCQASLEADSKECDAILKMLDDTLRQFGLLPDESAPEAGPSRSQPQAQEGPATPVLPSPPPSRSPPLSTQISPPLAPRAEIDKAGRGALYRRLLVRRPAEEPREDGRSHREPSPRRSASPPTHLHSVRHAPVAYYRGEKSRTVIFVTGLTRLDTLGGILDAFARFGRIHNSVLITTGSSYPITTVYIEFVRPKDASEAVHAMNGAPGSLAGHFLKVAPSGVEFRFLDPPTPERQRDGSRPTRVSRGRSQSPRNQPYEGRPRRRLGPGTTTIFVSGIVSSLTESKLCNIFSSFGRIKNSRIIASGAHKTLTTAYIEFHNPEDATRAVAAMHDTSPSWSSGGQPLRIEFSSSDFKP